MDRVLVAFALKEELAPWRRRHHFRAVESSSCPYYVTSAGPVEVHATLAGAGARHADRCAALASEISPTLAIVTGVAGGLKSEWRPGDLLVAESVCAPEDDATIASAPNLADLALRCGAKPARKLVTLPRIVRSPEEKAHLATVADAADMESLPLMKLWSALGIPSLAVRVILDPAEMPVTVDFESAMDAHGQVRMLKVFSQLARHPHLLPDFLHLATQSRHVLKILADFLDRFLEGLGLPSR